MRKIFCYFFLPLGLLFAATVLPAEEAAVREIFVPDTELGALFEGARDRVLIPRRDFEALLKQVREIRLEQAQPATAAPAEAILHSSEYTATIVDQRVEIEGVLEIELLTDDPVAVPLSLERVALLEAALDGDQRPAAIGRPSGDSPYRLVLEGRKTHRLNIRVITPLSIDSTRQSLEFQLPQGIRRTFKLSIPGDVELKAGAAVLARKVEDGATRFELLLPPAPASTQLLMTLNSHRVGTYRAVLARSVQFAEVTEQYERLHATVSLNELHQGIRKVSFYVPDGFEITDVRSVFLDRWNVEKAEPDTPEQARDLLHIDFREQLPGLTTINLSAIKTKVSLGESWSFPQFEPVDAACDSTVLGLLLEQELEVLDMKTERLYPIDTMTLKDAIPPSALDSLPGSPILRLALAYYAPRSDWSAQAEFRRPPPDCGVETEQLLTLSENEPRLQIDYRLTPRTGRVFDATIQVPAAWKILSVFDDGGRPLDFRPKTESGVLVRFPGGVLPGETKSFRLHAVGILDDWFKPGSEKRLGYPVFQYENASTESGTLRVRQTGEEDWEIVPTTLENTVVAEGPRDLLSFQYDSVPYTLELTLEKLVPRIKARVFSFYRFEPKLLRVRHEIDYVVEQASTRKLAFRLPAESPPTPDIRGLAGLPVKETFSEIDEQRNPEDRLWTVELARPMTGTLRVSVDYELPLDAARFEAGATFPLSGILAENVSWQSKTIAVEGDEELDIAIPTEAASGAPLLRPVDVGLLSTAAYRPGKRLLGVFSVLDETAVPGVTMTKNETDELPGSLIRNVYVVARLEGGKTGGVLYSILYEIQTAGGSLKATLSETDELWGVTLDGQAIKPQRVGGDLLIPVAAENGAELRRLVLLYRAPLPRGAEGLSSLSWPELTPAGKDGAKPLAVMRTSWNVIPPAGYEITRLGDVRPASEQPRPALFKLFRGGVELCSALIRKVDYSQYVPNNPLGLPSIGCSSPTLGVASTAAPASSYYDADQEDFVTLDSITVYEEGPVEINLAPSDPLAPAPPAAREPQSEELSKAWASLEKADSERMRWSVEGRDLPAESRQKKKEPEVARGRRLQSAQPVSVVVGDVGRSGPASGFSVIGERYAREIPLRLQDQSELRRCGRTTLLLAVFAGLCLANFGRKAKSAFVFGLLTLGTLLVFVPGLERFAPVWNGLAYGAALTGAIYLVLAAIRKTCSLKNARKAAPAAKTAPAATVVALLAFGLLPAFASADETEKLPKIDFPADAVIVPYSMSDVAPNKLPTPEQLTRPDQSLWVPYKKYFEMLQLVRDKSEEKKPARDLGLPYALSSAQYTATLASDMDGSLPLTGTLRIDVYSDQPVLVPLTLENAVFDHPLLDGKPASLKSSSDQQTLLLVEGRGSHELVFKARVRINRQGGWRIAEGKLPAASATVARLSIPEDDCDFLTANGRDKRKWSSTRNKLIETPLESNGRLLWSWRSAISEEGVDRNLEVESAVRVDVQEDGCWVRWTPTLRISRGRWEILRLRLPKDYVIAEILGENVRGWSIVETKSGDDDPFHTVDVELLKPAEKTETLSVRLVKTLETDGKAESDGVRLALPKLSIPDAGIHRGRVDLYRSTMRTIRVLDSAGLSPTDLPTGDLHTLSKFDAASPLGTSIFQSYRFVSENFAMNVESKPVDRRQSVHFFSALKLTKQETVVETRATIYVDNEPFLGTITLPENYRLRDVRIPEGTFWNLEKREKGGDLLHVSCGNAISGSMKVLLEGDFHRARSEDELTLKSLPVFTLDSLSSQAKVAHTSTIAVLTEPSLDVRAEGLNSAHSGNVNSVSHQIEVADQKELIRMGVHAGVREFSGRLVLTPRWPEVRCSTITNVRTTAEAIEETILLDFQIERAGIRSIEFSLPEWMRDAKIDAPFLRRKTVVPAAQAGDVLVRLELQEEVMQQLRILVQADRRLRSETDYSVTVPKIGTGLTTRQYVVLENDRRSPDEMLVSPASLVNLRALSRQQREWAYLASILGNNVTEAYCSQVTEENAAAKLDFRMRRREAVRLAEARIDLAETRLVLGENGEYRVEQIYRIDNKKEPYLDILLPDGAELWGARLLTAAQWREKEQRRRGGRLADHGQPVKPCRMPESVAAGYPRAKGKTAARLVRIPLIKTESGDLDYVVRLVYAGRLSRFKDLVKLDMPFVEVLNVPVGESLVRLYLPESYDYRFDGTMQQARQNRESETLQQAESNYFRQQDDRLQQAARSDNVFARRRALQNQAERQNRPGDIAQLGTPLGQQADLSKQGRGTLELSGTNEYAGETQIHGGAIQMMVTPQIVIQEEEEVLFSGNTAMMQSQFESQANYRANDMVNRKSFRTDLGKAVDVSGKANFDDNWFAGSNLSNSAGTALNAPVDMDFVGGVKDGRNSQWGHGTSGVSVELDDSTSGWNMVSDSPVVDNVLNAPKPEMSPESGVRRSPETPAPTSAPRQQMGQGPARQPQMAQQRNREVVNGQILIGEQNVRGFRDAEEAPSIRGSQSSRPKSGEEFPEEKERALRGVAGSSRTIHEPKSVGFIEVMDSKPQTRGGGVASPYSAVDGRPQGFESGGESYNAITVGDGLDRLGRVSGGDAILFKNSYGEVGAKGKDVAEGQVVRGLERSEDAGRFEPPIMGGIEVEGIEAGVVLKGISTRTASLDIEIPVQGKFFLFTTPQGSLDLSFRTVSTETERRGTLLGLSLLGLLLIYGVYRLCLGIGRRMRFDRRTHRATAALVTLLGVIALLIGAGFAFLIAMILAAVLWTSFFTRRFDRDPVVAV